MPLDGHRVRRPRAAYLLVQLAPGRLPALQRAGRGSRLRRREDHSRHGAFAARGRRRTAGQISQQHAFRHSRNAGAALRFHARRPRRVTARAGAECGVVRRFRAVDHQPFGVQFFGRQPPRLVGGRRRIYRPYRRRGLQTRPEMARAVPRLPQMFGLRRFAPQEGGAPVPHRRQEHRRRVGHVDLRIFGMGGAHRGLYGRQGVEDRTGGRQGDPRAPALPDGRRVGLPVAVAFVAFALGRREPAYSPRHADRLEAGQRALYPRRALDRPAPARQPAPDPQPGGVARCRQLGDRRRTRRGHDACRRLHRRRRPPCGAQGRAYHGRGYDRRHPAFRFHHGRLPHRTPPYRDSRNAPQRGSAS